MVYVTSSTLILAGLTVFFQDLKEREVSLWVLVLSILSAGFLSPLRMEIILINVLFISVQVLAVYTYCRVRNKDSLLKTLGMGDILFFLVPTLLLELPALVIFFIVSLLICVLLSFLFKWETIPLAGIQSICLLFWLAAAHFL